MTRTGFTAALALGLTACQPAAPAGEAATARAAPPTAPAAAPPASEVAFDHGDGLVVAPCGDERTRCWAVSDPAAEAFRAELFTVQVFDGPLAEVARAEAGFEPGPDGRLMTTYGRFEPVAVEAFRAGGLQGLRATVTCGISDPETGFHAGAGECLWAVVGDGTRTAVIASSGWPNGLDAAGTAAATLRFAPGE